MNFGFFYIRKPLPATDCLMVLPNHSPVSIEVADGFSAYLTRAVNLQKKGRMGVINFEVLFGNNCEKTIAEQVEESLPRKKYDLVFTLGITCTLIAKKITTKRRIFTPIVFAGVVNPYERGITQSPIYSGNHLTGISATPRDYTEQIEKLHIISRGSFKNIVIVATQIGIKLFIKELNNARLLFKQKEFNIIDQVIIDGTASGFRRFIENLTQADLVFIPRDTLVLYYIDDIINICNFFKIPTYSSDLASLKHGVLIGFGIQENMIGIEAAEKASFLLSQQRKPATIPVGPIRKDNSTLILNAGAIRFQSPKHNDVIRRLVHEENLTIEYH